MSDGKKSHLELDVGAFTVVQQGSQLRAKGGSRHLQNCQNLSAVIPSTKQSLHNMNFPIQDRCSAGALPYCGAIPTYCGT